MKENDILEVTIIDDNYMGNGIAKVDNITVFVPRTIKDEKVQIKITKIKKSIAEAQVIKIIEKSELRQKTKCPYYDKCGGCNLLHISYEKEQNLKEEYIKKLFPKYNKCINSYDRYNYRNKVTLHVKDNKLGLYEENTNNIIEIEKCLLLEDEINNIIETIKDIDLSKITEITIKKGIKEVLLSVNGQIQNKDLSTIIKNKKVTSIYQNNKLIYGNKYIKDKLGNIVYNNNDDSFFQINRKCTEKLYNDIKHNVNNCNKLLDLYCGTGSIGLYLNEKANHITGIEINKDSCECAKENITENNIKNYTIINSDASNIKENYDTIIVDPPRSGLNKKVINILNEIKAKQVIYISCNPSTLKRDIELLKKYEIKDINIYNMFPATKHIESLIVLERRNI